MPATIKFTPATLTVPENSEADHLIATLNVDGGKDGETFTYQLTNDFDDRFAIRQNEETGHWELVVLKGGSLFDFESAINSFALNITATGSEQTKVDPAAITVSVTNVNEHAPTDITLTGGTVAEDAPLNTDVAILSALDQDRSDTFTYTLVDANPYSRFKTTRSG
jgi:hypothetical protein